MAERQKMKLECNPINREFHTLENFREQVAILQLVSTEGDYAKFVRSFVSVGTAGSVGFDNSTPGQDSPQGWNNLSGMIEDPSMRVRGVFHTHPLGVSSFSSMDDRMQYGLAQAYGKMFIWHVVQAIGDDTAQVICMNMQHPVVFKYDMGRINHDVEDPILILPLPLATSFTQKSSLVEIMMDQQI